MRLKDLLQTFLFEHNVFKNSMLDGDWVNVLETKYSIASLDKILLNLRSQLNKSATATSIKPLQDFLAERWEQIRGTNLAYSHAPNNNLNALCLTLAKAIALLTGSNSNKLLMPTITNNGVTSTLDTLEVHEFILNDDDTQFIEILSTLEQAIGDGKLKRYDEQNNKHIPLTPTEEERLINHSMESKAYYNELKKVADLKNKGKSIGAYMTRLVTELNLGGAHGGKDGTEGKAGVDAFNAITDFHDILQVITPAERKFIFECSALALTVAKSFQTIWFRLLSRAVIEGKMQLPEAELSEIVKHLSSEENASNQEPCAELMAGNIEQIVEANKKLFDIYLAEPAKESMAILEKKREKAKAKLMSRNNDTNTADSSYTGTNKSVLKRLLSKPVIEVPASNIQIANGYQLKKILQSKLLSTDEYSKLLHFFGSEQLQEIIKDKFEFAELIVSLSTEQSNLLISLLTPAYFQKIFPTGYELAAVLKKFTLLPADKWQSLLPLFNMVSVQQAMCDLLTNELEEVPANSRAMFVETVGVNKMALSLQMIPSEKFCATLASFSPEHQKEIRAAYSQSLITNINALCDERAKKSTYFGLFKPRLQKTRSAHALKDVMENKADEKTLSVFEKQLDKNNDLGRIHRQWRSITT
jgi:hypothetical protein